MPEPKPEHILVVDDDAQVRLLLSRCFAQDGYRVSEAANQAEVMDKLAGGDVDLITLDLSLGKEDGLSIARIIRNQSQVPIIMVTGKGDTIDRVVGLELGADDYISKPFHVREVLARVRSVLRRTDARSSSVNAKAPQGKSQRYAFNGWVVDFSALELCDKEGGNVDLTTADFRLLEVLVKNPKRVFTRDQLMDQLKGNEWVPFDRSIDNQVSRLRKKIEADPKKPQLIKTVRGAGYSFAANVQPV